MLHVLYDNNIVRFLNCKTIIQKKKKKRERKSSKLPDIKMQQM
jgi:uncharacterized membrane protein YobD (UPF0266 family)